MAIMLIAQILVNKVCIYVICSSLQVFFLYFIIENPDIHLVNEIESLKTDIDKSNRSKTDFLSNMYHEIRTPMNAIVGFSDSLLNSSEFNEEAARNDIQSIATAGTNLVDIINNILDISKIESGNDTLVNKECSLDKIVKEIEGRLSDINIKIELDNTAKDYFVNNGYDEFYGARPLKRLVNKELETPLAKLLINGDIHENDTLIVSYDNKLIINKKNSD